MLRADEILKPVTKMNQTSSVCPLFPKNNFQQFFRNQACQHVLCEHVISSNRLTVLNSCLYCTQKIFCQL